MPDHTIRVDEEVYGLLIRIQGEEQAVTGKRYSLSHVIKLAIERYGNEDTNGEG